MVIRAIKRALVRWLRGGRLRILRLDPHTGGPHFEDRWRLEEKLTQEVWRRRVEANIAAKRERKRDLATDHWQEQNP